MMNENRIIISPEISRLSFYSTPCIIQCMFVSYMNRYIFLLTCLWCLLGSSILYWNDMTNKLIYNIDRVLAVSVLSIKSHIAYNNFDTVGRQIWYTSLFVSGSAYMLSLYLFQKKIILNTVEMKDEKEVDINKYTRLSVYYHMFFVHFLPTTTFSLCVLYYSRD